LLVAAILVVAVITYLLVWYGPDLIARHDLGPVTGPHWAIQLQQARDAARGRLLTLGAGLFATGALVYTALNWHSTIAHGASGRTAMQGPIRQGVLSERGSCEGWAGAGDDLV